MKFPIREPFELPKSTILQIMLSFSGLITGLIVYGLSWIAWSQLRDNPYATVESSQEGVPQDFVQVDQGIPREIPLPNFWNAPSAYGIQRLAILCADIQDSMQHQVLNYIVEKGDLIFKISKQFDINPETILWANSETLNDNPELLTIGMKLKIPATDGIYYQWKTGDTVTAVAARFKTEPTSILLWSENDLDLLDPIINPGSYIMIPGGKREMVGMTHKTISRGKSGVSKALADPGACETIDGAYGTGTFVWPAVNKSLSGNDYWSGHPALDITSNMGSPVFASDSGLVVYAGWNNTGYRNMVMIDHGNGDQTHYAHLSQVSVSCGSSVYQGSSIGVSGRSGNSSDPHLHFETRYLSGLVNLWSLMP